MVSYSGDVYVIIFFIYGLSFFSMGICALLQTASHDSNFTLLRHIKYLGYFGITHAAVEWILMIIIAKIYPEYIRHLITGAIFVNALSFALLLKFGIKLLEHDGKMSFLVNYLPQLIFSTWTASFLASYTFYHRLSLSWLSTFDVLSRYFIGLPAGIVTAIAFNKNSRIISRLNIRNVALKFKGLSFLFGLYAIFAGVFVIKKDFFPANTINAQVFYNYFGFPVEIVRASSALGITILFIGVVEIFRWETDQMIGRLSEQRAASQERRRLARELHDGTIQTLFATGLYVESLMETEDDREVKKGLENIKSSLNGTISNIREFLDEVLKKSAEVDDLKVKLAELISSIEKTGRISISFEYGVSEITLGQLSSEKLTQIYYIIQEALTNAVKHSKASNIDIKISSTLDALTASIIDNGKGFDIHKVEQKGRYGLTSMKERAASVGGNINFRSSDKGTSIMLTIPWEGCETDGKRY